MDMTLWTPQLQRCMLKVSHEWLYDSSYFFTSFLIIYIFVVAGGLCNHELGISTIQISIAGCPWIQTYDQNTFQKLYNGIPAHFIELQVTEIKGDPDPDNNDERSRIEAIWNFFQGGSPYIQTKDLLETSTKAESINEGIDDITNGADNTGIIDSIQASENQSNQESETVRFQYDGNLKMAMHVTSDRLSCNNYDSDTYPSEEGVSSFHVLTSMKKFLIKVTFLYDLTEGFTCAIVDAEDL